jgi:hypothetical protein
MLEGIFAISPGRNVVAACVERSQYESLNGRRQMVGRRGSVKLMWKVEFVTRRENWWLFEIEVKVRLCDQEEGLVTVRWSQLILSSSRVKWLCRSEAAPAGV